MVEDRPSLTAVCVSFARAVATIDRGAPGEGLDFSAQGLLPPAARALLGAVAMGATVSPRTIRAVRALSMGVVDHCEMRSLAIDEVARGALAHGARQLVLLGAGLDARGWRLREAASARVFEVDHPATQRYKRRRAPPSSGNVSFVPVDFERDDLGAELEAAGHDPTVPTLWIWEGVTPYLPIEATRATLRILTDRSGPGSTLAVTYVTPELVRVPDALKPFVTAGFAVLGEPLRGAIAPEAFAGLLESCGLHLASDTGLDDWRSRHEGARAPLVRIEERLAVARTRDA
jgi:methyltransferase (TIGR00027 family)